MPGFFESQIPLNLYLQALGGWLTPIMRFFTFLGQEDFFLLAIVPIYWLFDRRVGLRVGILLLLSNGINAIMKLAFHDPRPFWIDTRVKPMTNEPSFGFPSGHTQNAATTWGGFLLPMKRWWAVLVYALIITLVAISRFYLGMHFLIDAVGGLILGLITVGIYMSLEKKIESWIAKRSLRDLLLLSLLCSLAFIVIYGAVRLSLGNWEVPAEWRSNALIGWPDDEIDPLNIRNLIKSAGTILGMLAGAAWITRKYPTYSIQGAASQKIQRLVLGLAGLLAIYAGLGLVLPKDSSFISSTLTYLRFTLVGLWVTGLAPLLFIKTRLVPVSDAKATPA